MEKQLLEKISFEIRRDIIELCYKCKGGHVGGALSSADILTVLYFDEMKVKPKDPTNERRDYFFLSKGHIAEALYATLSKRGFFSFEELSNYSGYCSKYFGHPSNKVDGIEINTGALGHGLSIAAGTALSLKKRNKKNRVYTLLGDGELAEGSNWEAAMFASHYQLDNLCVIVDRNRLQISGTTEQVMGLESLNEKWKAFGFHVIETDGHDCAALQTAFQQARKKKNKPTVIIAHTIKGKGVSFMENDIAWHHGVITKEQYEQSLLELEEAKNGQ